MVENRLTVHDNALIFVILIRFSEHSKDFVKDPSTWGVTKNHLFESRKLDCTFLIKSVGTISFSFCSLLIVYLLLLNSRALNLFSIEFICRPKTGLLNNPKYIFIHCVKQMNYFNAAASIRTWNNQLNLMNPSFLKYTIKRHEKKKTRLEATYLDVKIRYRIQTLSCVSL